MRNFFKIRMWDDCRFVIYIALFYALFRFNLVSVVDIIYYNKLSAIFSMYSDCSKINKLKEVNEVKTIPERSPHTLIYRMTGNMKIPAFASRG